MLKGTYRRRRWNWAVGNKTLSKILKKSLKLKKTQHSYITGFCWVVYLSLLINWCCLLGIGSIKIFRFWKWFLGRDPLDFFLTTSKSLFREALANWSWFLISFWGSLAFQSINAAILSSLENVLPVGKVTTTKNQKWYFAFWWICLDLLPRQKFLFQERYNFYGASRDT